MPAPALHIKQVYKGFTEGLFVSTAAREQSALLKGVDLEVPQGKITALLGDNGSGKSTLLNIISGFLKADSGHIFLASEKEITRLSPAAIAQLGIGRMFQDNHIFPTMSLLENLLIADLEEYGAWPFQGLFNPRKAQRVETQRLERARAALDRLFGSDNELWNRRNEKAGTFSYGQQRLLGLARLLINDHSLLLLDEPSAGIHESVVLQMAGLIRSLMATRDLPLSILMVEHNRQLIDLLADYYALLEEGKITVFAPYSEGYLKK